MAHMLKNSKTSLKSRCLNPKPMVLDDFAMLCNPQSKSYYNPLSLGLKISLRYQLSASRSATAPRRMYLERKGRVTVKHEAQSHAGEDILGQEHSAQQPQMASGKKPFQPPALGPALPCSRHTHLLTVIFSEFIQKPGSLLPSQVPQEGSQDRTDMLWVGKEKREHAVIRAVIITSLQAWSGSTGGGISRPSLTAAID